MFSARHTRSIRLGLVPHAESPEARDFQLLGAATCVARTAPAPLVSPASRPSGVSPGACARRGALSFSPPAPAPHTRRYPALRAPTSPAHSRQHRLGLRVEGLLHLIEQPRHLALVARVRCQLRRDNQPMLAIDRHLRVAALPEPLGAGLHDGAVRVGEVALVFGFPASAWLPPLRSHSGCRPRASSASRCAARAFAATIAANRSARRRNSSGNSSPRSDPPKRASSSASVSRACSASISSTPLLRAHSTVAHRLALARVRPNLRPVYRQLPETRKPRLARQAHHLHEQPLELLQVPAAKLAQRAVEFPATRNATSSSSFLAIPRNTPVAYP